MSKTKGSSSFSRLNAAAVIACAMFLNYRMDVFVCLLPKYVDGYFVRLFWSRTKTNENKPIKMPVISHVPYYKIPLESAGDLITDSGYPRLVEKFATVDHDKAVGLLYKENKGRTMRMLETGGIADHPHFSPSCGRVSAGTRVDVAFDDFAENHLFKKNAKNHSGLYAGFESITDPETLEELLGIDIGAMGEYRQNNLFASNFPAESIASTLHCAPIDSVSIQLLGTKTWYFVSPEDLANIWSIPMPTAFNLPMTDDELLNAIPTLHVAIQRPGDAVYFGPNWCHAVSTSPGPNLMFNLRFKNIPKLKSQSPKSLFIKVAIRMYTRTIGGRPQDNEKNYPIIYNDLITYYNDCGLSDAWLKITKEVKACL